MKVGISQSTLSELEANKYLPSMDTVISISKAFNISTDWVLTGEDLKTNKQIPNLSKIHQALLELFNKLSKSDQDEIIALMFLKNTPDENLRDFIEKLGVDFK